MQEKLLYVISIYNHRAGIRHLIFLTSLILYTLLGGLIFNAIESTPSQKLLQQTITLIEANIADLSNRLANISEADNITVLIQVGYRRIVTLIFRKRGKKSPKMGRSSSKQESKRGKFFKIFHYGAEVSTRGVVTSLTIEILITENDFLGQLPKFIIY